jgi:ribulose-phosphate 3-epimerase
MAIRGMAETRSHYIPDGFCKQAITFRTDLEPNFDYVAAIPCHGAVLEFPQLQLTLDPILIELAPSILSADFAHLADQVERATAGGGSVIHVDVMDGHFVPNLTIGPPVVKSLRQATRLPLDCHLMIENPDQYIADFAEAGADWISVHQETCPHLNRTLNLIKQHECRAGVVINPATPVETLSEVLDIVDYVLVMSVNPGFGGQKFIPGTLHKMKKLAEIRAARGYEFRIEVDGGVGMDTVADVVRAGAEILVAGNAVFGKGDAKANAQALLGAARSASLQRV